MVALMDKQEVVIPAPELRGAVTELFTYPELEIGVDGPAGCVAGETRIYNPVTGEHTPIRELYERQEAPMVQTLIGAIQAEVPFRKGVADLYRLTLASGRKCIVTSNHLLLSDNSWIFLDACEIGTRLLISAACPYPTTEAPGPSVSRKDAVRLSYKPLSSQPGYSAYYHQYGVRPRTVEDIVQSLARQQDDVHAHIHADLCTDDQELLSVHSRQHLQSDLLAKTYYSPSPDGMAYTQSCVQPETSSPIDVSSLYDALSQIAIDPLLPTFQPRLDVGNMPLHARYSVGYYSLLADAALAQSKHQPLPLSISYSSSSHTSQVLPVSEPQLDACNLSNDTSNSFSKSHYTIQWDTVSSIEYVRTDEYFDLHVPIAEHYLAEGIWHHNTGKTYGILYIIHCLLLQYPGAKALVARKRNTDLAGSALATFRENIMDEREGVRYFGGNKVKPAMYEYPNGSMMVVNGLDRPGKVKSMDFDIIYINEATDCELDDIEMCHIRLARRQSSTLPQRFQKLLMDFNPDAPTHFLNLRMNEGTTRRLISRHEDNPFLYDLMRQEWTEAGARYISELETLTGVRLARYRYGLWAAAEGTVYEKVWNRAIHVIDPFPIPKEWPRYVGLDFGYTNPFVCKWYARDDDGRLYMYREIYMTQRLVEDHCKQIKHVSRWGQDGGDPLPREIIGDHDAEDRATFERHTGFYVTPAHKSVSDGIQAQASRLKPAGDDKPRLFYFSNALVERDRNLADRKKPTCTVEEYDSYIWEQSAKGIKEQPVKEDDHGLDTDRYVIAHFDLHSSGVTYFKDIWR